MTISVATGLSNYESSADLRAAKMRMGEALPDSGWLADYLRAVTPLTDAPVEFHLASGLAALSAAVGNHLFAVHWGQNVFPHLWTVLVAPSSFWRKSTSINQAEGLLREAAPDAVYPSDFSREKLLRILAKDPAGLLTLREFGGFLATLGRDYMGGMKENLTELYDGPDLFKRSLQSGDIEVRRPAITVLGATTLDWLEGRITEGDLQGGFLARFLFVTAREKASAKGLTGGMDGLVRMRLRDALRYVHNGPVAEIVYDPDAKELLDDWMQGWEAEVTGTSHRADLSGFAVRLQTYAVKLAIVYRLSAVAFEDDAPAHRIDAGAVTQAIAYCRVLWANVAALIDEKIAITKEAKELRRLLGIVGAGTTRSQALKLSKLKARDFDQYLDTLVQSGQVSVSKVAGSEVGLQRERDRKVVWLSPVEHSRNGHSEPLEFTQEFPTVPAVAFASVPNNSPGTVSDGELEDNSRELEGSEPSTESPYSSLLSHSLSHDESGRAHGGDTRARRSERKRSSDRAASGIEAVQPEPTAADVEDPLAWL
jgi:Protein of unknown function (DUF3987)